MIAMLGLKLLGIGRGIGGFLKSLTPRAWLVIAGVALVIGGVWYHKRAVGNAYDQGVTDQKAAQARQIAADKLVQAQREKLATDALSRAVATDTARIASNRKEIDDATRNIPDQAPTARQLVRVCVELRRQGQNPPACQHIPAAKSVRTGR